MFCHYQFLQQPKYLYRVALSIKWHVGSLLVKHFLIRVNSDVYHVKSYKGSARTRPGPDKYVALIYGTDVLVRSVFWYLHEIIGSAMDQIKASGPWSRSWNSTSIHTSPSWKKLLHKLCTEKGPSRTRNHPEFMVLWIWVSKVTFTGRSLFGTKVCEGVFSRWRQMYENQISGPGLWSESFYLVQNGSDQKIRSINRGNVPGSLSGPG